MFFKDFPSFLYDFNYGNDVVKTDVVKDITRNIRVKREILSNISLFDHYDIIDGETPEIISEKFYGTPEYHWVVMLANEKYDWLSDFPLMESDFPVIPMFNDPPGYRRLVLVILAACALDSGRKYSASPISEKP